MHKIKQHPHTILPVNFQPLG